jgi:hypothetical protein
MQQFCFEYGELEQESEGGPITRLPDPVDVSVVWFETKRLAHHLDVLRTSITISAYRIMAFRAPAARDRLEGEHREEEEEHVKNKHLSPQSILISI